jgi:hypothetical protein
MEFLMQIYTGLPFTDRDCDNIERLELGVMMTPGYGLGKRVMRSLKNNPAALDNGAYRAWRKGEDFNEAPFLKTLEKIVKEDVRLEIIAVPDIIAGGMKSYEFSQHWKERLTDHDNLFLVVQDGMPYTIDVEGYSGIFIGGTMWWKWETAREWISIARNLGIRCHMGRVGTAYRLHRAQKLGLDSVDSTNFVRNNSWHHVEKYLEYKRNPPRCLFEL